MPNWVTQKIIFDAAFLDKVKELCLSTDVVGLTIREEFDFNRLLPTPIKRDWDYVNDWREVNWGTKSNAVNTNYGLLKDGRAFLRFATSWTVPYPIICAFADTFKIPFMYYYFDEGGRFWGEAEWAIKDDSVARIAASKNSLENRNAIYAIVYDSDYIKDHAQTNY